MLLCSWTLFHFPSCRTSCFKFGRRPLILYAAALIWDWDSMQDWVHRDEKRQELYGYVDPNIGVHFPRHHSRKRINQRACRISSANAVEFKAPGPACQRDRSCTVKITMHAISLPTVSPTLPEPSPLWSPYSWNSLLRSRSYTLACYVVKIGESYAEVVVSGHLLWQKIVQLNGTTYSCWKKPLKERSPEKIHTAFQS